MSETTRTPADSLARSSPAAAASPPRPSASSPSDSGSGGNGHSASTAPRPRGAAPPAEPLQRRHEPAVHERRAETERGVVAAELERRGVRLDDLDPILEPRRPVRSRAGATNSGARSTHVIRQPNSSASTSAGPPFPDAMSRTCESGPRPSRSPSSRILSALVGFMELVLRLDDGMPPGHLRPRRYASYAMRRPPAGCTSTGSNAPSSPTRACQTIRSSRRAPM